MRNNQLLTLAKRYSDGPAYILPGGRQEDEEPVDQAISRECREEIGTDVPVDHLLFVRESIGKNRQSRTTDSDVHPVAMMVTCQVPDDYTPRIGIHPDEEQAGVTRLPIDTLDTVRYFPAALKKALLQADLGTSTLVTGIKREDAKTRRHDV